MHMDAQYSVQPEGTYPIGMNIINRDEYQSSFKSNEHGTIKLEEFPDVIGDVFMKDLNETTFITKDGSIKIFNYDQNKKIDVASFAEFGCPMEVKDCEYINVRYTKKGCDSYLHWSSNNIYYWVNLSELRDPKRKESLIKKLNGGDCKDCNTGCDYFKIFRPKNEPKSKLDSHQYGGSLPAGTYVTVPRLINEDKTYTNWGVPSRTVHVGSEHNIPGEESTGRLSITYDNLDCNYSKIEIVVIYYNGSTITARSNEYYYSKDSFTVEYHQLQGTDILIDEILIKSQVNLEGSDLFNYDGMMYYFGIKPRKEYNIQKIASKVTVKWIAEKYTLEDAKRYNIKTLPYGESIALGLVINHDDGSHSYVGHIPCGGAGSSSLSIDLGSSTSNNSLTGNTGSGGKSLDINSSSGSTGTGSGSGSGSTGSALGNISIQKQGEYKRTRTAIPDTPSDLSNNDELIDIEKQLIESYTTDVLDLVNVIRPACSCQGYTPPDPPIEGCCPPPPDELNQFCNVCNGHKDADLVLKDIQTAEKIGVKWLSILGDYIGRDGKTDLKLDFKPNTIKEVALDIIDAIKKRERVIIEKTIYKVTKNVSYGGGSNSSSINSLTGFAPTSNPQTPSYPNGIIVATGSTKCKVESREYPCIRDCYGNPIYEGLTGSKIRHHKLPDETELTFFESKSIGVPSIATPDADEYADHYGVYLGLIFENIIIDYDDYYKVTGKKVSKTKPFNIVQAELNYSNKTILTKGLMLSNYVSSNQGKEYDYQPHAVNSMERVNKYIDINDSRWDPGAGPSNTVCMYSLDQQVLQPSIAGATKLKILGRMTGNGFRHYLYTKGKKVDNATFGRRIDRAGCVSATNLSTFSAKSADYDVTFYKYIKGGLDSVEAPGPGATRPLMNKYGQDCLWIGLNSSYSVKDDSFVGDVLDHKAPLYAEGDYAVLYRDLPDQYGSLETINYIPILEADGDVTTAKGLVGDRFISPYSYIKTSWVSDKVGNKFPISNMVAGKEDRCHCDNPEDAIHSLIGKWFLTELPTENDKANAKNWAGTHTPGDARSKQWSESFGVGSESQYYYPGTLTHLNTFTGESEANPFMVQRSDSLAEQRYPYIKTQYFLEATKHPCEDSYLSQFSRRIEQPSAGERMIKILIDSLINLGLLGGQMIDILNPESALESIGDITTFPITVIIYFLLSKVLFTNDFIDEFLGLPQCKMDSEGGLDYKIEGYHKNFNKYSFIFSQKRNLYQYRGMQEFTNCGCNKSNIDIVYISDKQVETSFIDSYKSVRPGNYFVLNQGDGKLIDIFTGVNGGLFAHTTDSILSLIEPQTRTSTNGIFDIITGNKKIYPVRILGSSYEGHAGILNRSHAIDSRYGRFFIDYEADELFLFNGRGVEPLSKDKGVATLFKNYTKYCEPKACRDEYTGQHYTLGIDPRFHRLLITKSDDKKSWTISYDLLDNYFVSFHSYIPRKYLFTREDMYALYDNKLYSFKKTQDIESKYNNYFEKQYGFYIDVKSVIGFRTTYASHIIRTNMEKNVDGNLYKNIFQSFDKVSFWGSNQTGGVHFLDNKLVIDRENDLNLQDNYGVIPIDYIDGEFRFSEFYDYTDVEGNPVIKKEKCLPFIEPINYACVGRDSQNWSKRVIADSMFYTRLERTELSNAKLYIKTMILHHNHKMR